MRYAFNILIFVSIIECISAVTYDVELTDTTTFSDYYITADDTSILSTPVNNALY